MHDENSEKTIADLHGLGDDDPWDDRSEAAKTRDRLKRQLRNMLEKYVEDTPAPSFIDPPDDENPKIMDGVGKIFYRLAVSDSKLKALLAAEPSLVAVGLMARNTAGGCWIALNSARVARRIADTLTTQGFIISLQIVDAGGNSATHELSANQRTVFGGEE